VTDRGYWYLKRKVKFTFNENLHASDSSINQYHSSTCCRFFWRNCWRGGLGFTDVRWLSLAGIVIGLYTGFVGDIDTIQQLAELGVIFLMFGVGLHFSFQDLWRVRDIAIPGALGQTTLATLLGIGLSQLWGWTLPAGIVLGLSISVASTVVLLRGLMDNSLLNSSPGHAAVGWLVMEDILLCYSGIDARFCIKFRGFDWQNWLLHS